MNGNWRPALDTYERKLREVFGYEGLNRPQRDVLRVLYDEDVLLVMPTGGGKSMCYVLPALLGVSTLVVSPSISLMEDQVTTLREQQGVTAAYVNSTQDIEERFRILKDFRDQKIKLLYLSPEQLANESVLNALGQSSVSLMAIDEAHLISEWGHTFRLDYLNLNRVRRRFGSPRTLAVTATARTDVAGEIVRGLGIPESKQIIRPADRPNLNLRVEKLSGRTAKERYLLDEVKRQRGKTGIIYASSKKKTEELTALIRDAGFSARYYHSDIPDGEKTRAQSQFMNDQIDVMVATNAFGMGIDKPDVRYVIHFDVPQRLESYYQEAGRAGRDGEYAECTLLMDNRAWQSPEYFINSAHPGSAEVTRIWAEMTQAAGRNGAISSKYLKRVPPIVQLAFQEQGLLDISSERLLSLDSEVVLDQSLISDHEEHEREMLGHMKAYVYGRGCRAAAITEYFGHQRADHCGMCDNCDAMTDEEVKLFSELHSIRSSKARNLEIEPMRVLDQQVMWNLIRSRPVSETDLEAVPGIGSSRMGWVGKQVLKLFATSVPLTREKTAPSRSPRTESRGDRQELHDRLLAWRTTKHRQMGVPAYVVLNDETLGEIAASGPQTVEELLDIRGIGPHKLEQFGSELLRIVRGAVSTSETRETDRIPVNPDHPDQELLAKLKEWRLKISREAGLPAYTVLHDLSLEQISTALPRTGDELLAIKRVGPAKLERYGDEVLRIVRDHVGDRVPEHEPSGPGAPEFTKARLAELTFECEIELKEWRRETAAGLGIPAFRIFSDRTLRNLARARPTDERGLLEVNGIGQWTSSQHGSAILSVINRFLKSRAD